MAAPISMDLGEAGEIGKGSKSGGSLAVSKSSSKIRKGLRPTLAQPRLAPQVYKTEPSDFRSLVQQLTGTSQPANPPPSGPKPPISRLQRIAPPPLRPTGTYPALIHPPAQSQAQASYQPQTNPATTHQPSFPFANFSPLSNHGASPFSIPPPLSFSPLPKLSPSDQGWVNALNGLESPSSAVIRQLAEKIVEGNGPSSKPDTSATATSSLPPMSPTFSNLRFSNTFGLPSPTGFPSPNGFGFGLGNVYGSSSCFTPSAALAMDATFSFPEPDLAMSPASTP
ncbi:uncharacterized protein [Physcomitrium patens]|uniref:VQ domain-containing protein n=1 Tax=Physcomitrium patens TaxID=3218 RepID=A0A2K1L4M5_PHYPA|nr:proline-rich receptor-like protein kinase PERK2 [Physcomitrium patens]XP_024368169.1 proline-rich receptor-like protein kinase PERK2 [Physcomitrium patens]PNR60980.1 hypothetical protein PHYPA_003773 [Physcomitrium patens]|eukprot:XP_024368168.1 proline-rich receptor-like protein kinase PERK2 [Physcomitrella patens]